MAYMHVDWYGHCLVVPGSANKFKLSTIGPNAHINPNGNTLSSPCMKLKIEKQTPTYVRHNYILNGQ